MNTSMSEKETYLLLVSHAADQSVPTFVHARSPEQLFIQAYRGIPNYVNIDRGPPPPLKKVKFVSHGDYSSTANCRTNFAYFEGY
jgi:hypothetical protein